LHSLLASHIEDLTIVGVDVNPRAVNLGYKNKAYNLQRGHLTPRAEKEVSFLQADILDPPGSDMPSLMNVLQTHFGSSSSGQSTWDVLISNPPYISPLNLVNGTTSRSVRRYEPVEALVPPVVDPSIWQAIGLESIAREDIFYAKLLSLVRQLDVKIAVLECGDLQQAQRVVDMAHDLPIAGDEKKEYAYIWDDCYTTTDQDNGARAVIIERRA
jgi:methylase of polypeptide subunit release factors